MMDAQDNTNESFMELVKGIVPDKIVRNEIREHFFRRWSVISDQANGLQGKELEEFCTKIAPDFGGWVIRFLFALMGILAIPAFFSGITGQFALGGFGRAAIATLISVGVMLASIKLFYYFEGQTWDYEHARSTRPESGAAIAAIHKLHKHGLLFQYFRYCVNKEEKKQDAA